mgnify:CR=1 FL=1
MNKARRIHPTGKVLLKYHLPGVSIESDGDALAQVYQTLCKLANDLPDSFRPPKDLGLKLDVATCEPQKLYSIIRSIAESTGLYIDARNFEIECLTRENRVLERELKDLRETYGIN